MYNGIFLAAFVFLTTIFAVGQPTAQNRPRAQSRHTWERLKLWANEQPVSPKHTIFSDPELHQALLDLLGDSDFQRLMEDFKRSSPADVIEGYLVIHGDNDTSAHQEHAFVIIWLGIAKEHVQVVFKSVSAEDWRPVSQYSQPNVNKCILRMVREATH